MGYLDSLGGLGNTAVQWLTSTAAWVFIILVILIGGIIILVVRKRRKMDKLVLEFYDLGGGYFDFKVTKGGWFKSKFTLGGLWDYGREQRFRLKDMSPVDNLSHNDYRTINGKTGIAVVRNPNDPKMVFPISKFYVSQKSRAIMGEVANADFREAASKAIEDTDKELQSKWEQYLPFIVTGVVIIIALIITLLNTQYGKYMVDKAAAMIIEARNTPCMIVPSPATGGGGAI